MGTPDVQLLTVHSARDEAVTPTVELSDVELRLRSRQILSGVNVSLRPGITALLGLNGAGKSRFLEVLAGYRKPTAGRVLIRPGVTIGYLPQNSTLAGRVTPADVVAQSLWLHGWSKSRVRRDVPVVLDRWDLTDEAGTQIRSLSGGTVARVSFAVATAHDPDLLLLDEPTVGLDADRLRDVRDLIARQRHRTVVISSHIAADVEALADRVVLIVQGAVVFQGTVHGLRNLSSSGSLDDAIITVSRRSR